MCLSVPRYWWIYKCTLPHSAFQKHSLNLHLFILWVESWEMCRDNCTCVAIRGQFGGMGSHQMDLRDWTQVLSHQAQQANCLYPFKHPSLAAHAQASVPGFWVPKRPTSLTSLYVCSSVRCWVCSLVFFFYSVLGRVLNLLNHHWLRNCKHGFCFPLWEGN